MILGDANLAEVSTYLKLGTTAIVLSMIEDRFLSQEFTVEGAVSALRAVSHDPTLQQTITLTDGRKLTAVQLQMEYLDLAKKYVEDRFGSDADSQTVDVLRRWESVLDRLERDPMLCATELDWVAKLKLLEQYRQRDGLELGGRQAPADRLPVLRHPPGEGALPPPRRDGPDRAAPRRTADRGRDDDPPEDTAPIFRGRCRRSMLTTSPPPLGTR